MKLLDRIGGWQDRATKAFFRAPLTWILLVLFALTFYWREKTQDKLTNACVEMAYYLEGPLSLSAPDLKVRATDVVTDVVKDVVAHDRLMKAETPEGEAYRWRFRTIREIERNCNLEMPLPETGGK